MSSIDLNCVKAINATQPLAQLDKVVPKKLENSPNSVKVNEIGLENLKPHGLLKKNITGIGSWLIGKVGGRIAILGSGLTQRNLETHKKLEELSGGHEFGEILSIIGHHPQTLSSIQEALGGFFGNAAANFGALSNVLETMLFQTVVNVSRKMKAGDSNAAITPINVISFLFSKIADDLNAINFKLAAIHDVDKETKKKEMILALREELLTMLFPNGLDDIPLTPLARMVYGLRSFLWNFIKTKVEGLLYNLDDLRKLKQLPINDDSESIKKDSRRLAQACVQISQAYLTSDSESVAINFIKNSPIVAGMGLDEQQRVIKYFSAQIQEFGKPQNPGIHNAWILLGGTLESFMTLIIANLSKDKKPDETISVMLVSKVLKTLSSFVKHQKTDIDKNIKELEKRKKNPAQIKIEKSHIDNFLPLAKSYREMTGLVELPELLKGMFDTLFSSKIPQLLAQNYEEVILPLVELFDAVDGIKPSSKPVNNPEDEGLYLMCDVLGKSVANRAPTWVEGQSKNIADNIASNIPKASKEIKEWVSEWINGKLIELANRKNEKLWSFVESSVPDVVAHILINLSKEKQDHKNLIFNSLNTLLERFNSFASSNGIKLEQTKNDRAGLIAIFTPFCESLMKEFGIGNGKKLPVPQLLNTTAEEQLKKILPELCAQYYFDFFALSQNVATIEQLKEQEANEGLAKLTEIASQLVSKWTPTLLEENSKKIAENIVSSIFPSGRITTAADTEKKQIINEWLTEQLAVIAPKLNKEYPEIWSLLGQGVEHVLTHIFYNISKGNATNTEASLYGITQILNVLQAFIAKNQSQILEKFEQLKQQKVKAPFSHEEMIQIFIPLAENFQKIMGLSEFSGIFNDVFKTLFIGYAPGFLAKHYLQSFLPLNDLYESINSPRSLKHRIELEKLPGGAQLASWCEIAGNYIGEEIPKTFEDPDQCIDLSARMALKLIMTIANPEQKAILEKQTELPLRIPEELLDLHNWACSWFESKIKKAGSSQDPHVRKLWDFAKFSVDDLLAYIMLNLADDKPNQDALFVVINKIMNSYILFNNKHGEKIKKAYLEIKLNNKDSASEKQQDPTKDKHFVALFLPLFQSIMQKAGIRKGQQLPIPQLLAGFGEEQLEKFIPQIFAELYCNFNSIEETDNRSKYLNLIQIAANPLNLNDVTPQGEAINAIEGLSTFFASQLVTLIRDLKITKKNSKSKTTSQVRLDKEIKLLKDPQIKKLWDGLESSISSIILQLFANHFEAAHALGKSINHEMAIEIINKLLTSLFVFTPEEETAIDTALQIPTPLRRKKALKELFSKRIADLLSIINPAQNQAFPLTLPFPQPITELIWNQLENSFLPEFLSNIYLEKVKGQKQAEIETAEMERITGSKVRSEICETLASFVSKFVPAFSELEHSTIAGDIFEVVSRKLGESGKAPGAEEVENYLKHNKDAFIKEMGEVMFKTALTLKGMQPITKECFKTVLIQVFSAMTKRVESFENSNSENYDKNFLLKQGIDAMKLINEHFKALNMIQHDNKTHILHKLDGETIIKALVKSKALHPGVPQSKEALKAQRQFKDTLRALKSARSRVETLQRFGALAANSVQRQKVRIKELRQTLHRAQKIVNQERIANFCTPFTKDLLEIIGFTSADSLPFPSPLKEIIWDQLQNQILPNVILSVFQEILEPQALNQMIMTSLEAYNAPEGADGSHINISKDPMQKELDLVCGELIQQIAQVMPNSFAKKALKFDKIKNMSAEKIGQSIRIQLGEKLSLQKIIDMSLPSLDRILKEGTLPSDDDAFEIEAFKKLHAEEVSLRKVRTDMKNTAHKTISELISSSISQIGEKFFGFWNKAVDKVFGKHTNSIKTFFNFIGFRVVYTFIKWTLIIAATPLILVGWLTKKIFWAFMDRHIAKEVDNVVKTVHMPIHEDLLYKLTERLVKSLKHESPNEVLADLEQQFLQKVS